VQRNHASFGEESAKSVYVNEQAPAEFQDGEIFDAWWPKSDHAVGAVLCAAREFLLNACGSDVAAGHQRGSAFHDYRDRLFFSRRIESADRAWSWSHCTGSSKLVRE